MSSFAESFWSTDYAAGLGILFSKLQQGVIENRQVLTMARMRGEAEEIYGQHLGDIAPAVDKISGGFTRDDGASVRKAYDGVRSEMEDAAKNHKKIAQNIRDLVVTPFSRWCDGHETRLQDSQDELQALIKAHDKQAETVKKLRSNYFNKCRLVEDIEEENKLGFQDPQASPKANNKNKGKIPEVKVSEARDDDSDEEESYTIGDEVYVADQLKEILAHMLNNIKIGETKVPILGKYPNTSAGTDVVDHLQRHMGIGSIAYAEKIGQDMVSLGFLRLIGNVGSNFANSSKMFYQWQPKAFQLADVPPKLTARTQSLPTSSITSESTDSPIVGTVSEYLAQWNVINGPRSNEAPEERMRREAREADAKYQAGVQALDELRCGVEEAIFVHLRFLERCELDRLKAIKTVILDFSGAISNVIPGMQATIDNMLLFQETVQPLADLRYFLETYRTGRFVPKVVTYENYYNKVDDKTFGIDLEARARADKKRVPIIVTTILTYLDHHYPDLEGDAARRGVWLADVPLSHVHALRAKVNDGKPIPMEVLTEVDISVVAQLLKLYLLELPDSLVSSHVYDIIRNIYNSTTASVSVSGDASSSAVADGSRVPVLQQTLAQLRLANIATLDACMNHFTRLIDLTSADEEYVSKLAAMLAPAILRPRTETSLTMEEKHAYRMVRDLFAHKDAIFDELKRLSVSHTSTAPPRPRTTSSPEASRRSQFEERSRALLEKAGNNSARGRGPSPAPTTRTALARDKSPGRPETRFPIHTGQTTPHRQSFGPILPKRSSIEAPDGSTSSPTGSADSASSGSGSATTTIDSPPAVTSAASTTTTTGSGMGAGFKAAAEEDEKDSTPQKRNSLGRSGATRSSLKRRVAPAMSLVPETRGDGHAGVTLVDRPMHD